MPASVPPPASRIQTRRAPVQLARSDRGGDGCRLQAHGHDDAHVGQVPKGQIHVRRVEGSGRTAEHGDMSDPRGDQPLEAPISVGIVRDHADRLDGRAGCRSAAGDGQRRTCHGSSAGRTVRTRRSLLQGTATRPRRPVASDQSWDSDGFGLSEGRGVRLGFGDEWSSSLGDGDEPPCVVGCLR